MTQHREAPRSISRLIALFERIADSQSGGMTLADLSIALDSPKSSLLNLLRPLVSGNYLAHENQRYFLGPEVFSFASRLLANSRFANLIGHYMEQLRDETRETVIFVSLDRTRDSALYVDVRESTQAIRYSVRAGELRPLYCTAAGLLLLAYQERSWREDYLARTDIMKMTERTVTDAAKLEQMMAEIRRVGHSFSSEQAIIGAGGVAAPIFGMNAGIVGALLIGAPAQRAEENRDALTRSIVRATRSASLALGCLNYDQIIRAMSEETSVAAFP